MSFKGGIPKDESGMYDEYHREQADKEWAKAKRWIKRLIDHCESAADLIEADCIGIDEEDINDERGFVQEAKEFYESM